ncbi:MAG: c-type cytochrome [Burkholderiales bacterium]
MAIAIVLVLLIVGTVLFHFLSPWWFTPIASNWGAIDDTIGITFWVTGFVFVAVNLFMAWVVLRYRHRKQARAHYEPENKKLEWWLIGFTTLGIVAMLAPGLAVWAKFVDVPKDAAEFEVISQQWHWSYRFPGRDGVLGTVSTRFIDDANPFGLNPDDPNGRDDVLVASQEVHLPLGKPVKLRLRSKDVLHNFAVAELRVKMDMVPGMIPYLWFTPTRAGKYDILCQELCGVGHFTMRGRLVLESDEAFQKWLAGYPTFAQTSARVAGDAEAGKGHYAVCGACHGAQGEGNPAMNAPRLAGQGDWYLTQQLHYFKQGIRGAHKDDTHGKTMAPMAAALPDEAAVRNVVAYIATLPDAPAPAAGKATARGRAQYEANCGTCHGAKGQGIQAMNAPRIAGLGDWYLTTQIRNFRNRVRGAHPDDKYGSQMGLMAATLVDEQATRELVAYVNGLR